MSPGNGLPMSSIAFIAFTQRGRQLAQVLAAGIGKVPELAKMESSIHVPTRLHSPAAGEPCPALPGLPRASSTAPVLAFEDLGSWAAAHFATDDALVFVGATGIAVRAIAPHVRDKFRDPAVVAIDEAGRFAIPLISGHVGGANRLARTLAGIAGGQAAVLTATDVNGVFAVDEWAAEHGLAVVERNVAKRISARLLEGGVVGFAEAFAGLPRPHATGIIEAGKPDCPSDLGFTVSLDEERRPFASTLHLIPRVVVVGVGCRRGVSPEVLAQAVDDALADAGACSRSVRALATIDVKRDEPAIGQLAASRGWDLRYYRAEELQAVAGDFEDSPFVAQAVGVGNVCERAALAQGGTLLLGKRAAAGVTVAVAREDAPRAAVPGKLAVVGLGPGGSADLTGRARRALASCDVIVGYPVYVDLVRAEFPGKELLTTPMRKEVERCRMALNRAAAGQSVALVCSGDPGVYGMAGPVLELAGQYPGIDIEVVPGVSAANGGAAVLGAPLAHDWCCISLSDLLTPWNAIERRLSAAAASGMAIVLYNPASRKRPHHLQRACDILLGQLGPETPCGIVRNIGREGQEARTLPLGELRDTPVDMFTTVFVGNSQTRELDGRLVTPRRYRMEDAEGADESPDGPPQPDAGRRGDAQPTAFPEGVRPSRPASILLFGGTSEGRRLAEWLDARGNCDVVACTATEYGGELLSGLERVRSLVGPLSDAQKEALLERHGFACVVDATHPYATHISQSVARMAQAHGIPLLRVVRAQDDARPPLREFADASEAAAFAATRPGNMLLTIGTHGIGAFVRVLPHFAERLYVRVLPVEDSIARVRAQGIPAGHIVAMQGPFSQGLNEALLRELDISILVTKASGAAGGFSQKVRAARACGVEVLVIGRPAEEDGVSLEEAQRLLEVRYGA